MNIQKLKNYVKEHHDEIAIYKCQHINDYGEVRYYYGVGKEEGEFGKLIGWRIKNYKVLCELLDEKIKTSNSKKAQIKNWQRYFGIERDGNAYIVKLIDDASVDSDSGWSELTHKKRPLLYYGKNNLQSGMKEVNTIVTEGMTFNKDYLSDLNEYMLISDLWNYEYKCYTENDLARLFQYINLNYGRYTGKRHELAYKTKIPKEVIDKFFQLTKKSYCRIIDNSLKKIESDGWIKKEKVLCGYDIKVFTEGYYTQTEYGDDELKYKVNEDVKAGMKQELTEAQITIYKACEKQAIENMANKYPSFKNMLTTKEKCKRFNYQSWIKIINEETSHNMGLLYIKENYKISLTKKARDDFFDTVVYDIFERSINSLYQNQVYVLKLLGNNMNRIIKQENKMNIDRMMQGEEGLSQDALSQVITKKVNENHNLIKILISLKKEDAEFAKEILKKKN